MPEVAAAAKGRKSIARAGPRGLPAGMLEESIGGPTAYSTVIDLSRGRVMPSNGPAIATSSTECTEAEASMDLIPWEIRTNAGELLGEVEAAVRAGAAALAEGRWPGRTCGMYVWSKRGLERDRRKLERKCLRNRPRFAHHEAGHAVLARRLGIGVELISLRLRMNETAGRFDPEGDSYARTITKAADHRDGLTLFERDSREAVCVLGGPMAESRYLGRPRWAELRGRSLDHGDAAAFARWARMGAYSDCGCLTGTVAGARPGPDRHDRCVVAYRRRIKARAAAELDACWREVEAVAAALQERLELDGDGLDRILSAARSAVEVGASGPGAGCGVPGGVRPQRRREEASHT